MLNTKTGKLLSVSFECKLQLCTSFKFGFILRLRNVTVHSEILQVPERESVILPICGVWFLQSETRVSAITTVCGGWYVLTRVSSKEDGLLRTMNADKLLKTIPVLQTQLGALLEFDCSANDLTNGIINMSFMLLFRDLIRLFACYNDAIINLLGELSTVNVADTEWLEFKTIRKILRHEQETVQRGSGHLQKIPDPHGQCGGVS